MSQSHSARLTDRGVLQIGGPDASGFLQGLITNDIEKLCDDSPSCHAGLLTPQGKILFDFFVLAQLDHYLIDVDRQKAAELAKRLGFYKLRAKVEIADLSDNMTVSAVWGGTSQAITGGHLYTDPRLTQMGQRHIGPADSLTSSANEAAYHSHRIELGVPEGAKDFAFGDAFPHEVNMNVLAGVDFDKGCYVGQEIVSRMQHRGTTRKRIIPISTAQATTAPLPAIGSDIRAGKAPLGKLGSSAGSKGLAMIRLDRAAEALAKDDPIIAGDECEIELHQPDWATFEVPVKAP